MRVLLDINIFISYLLTPPTRSSPLADIILAGLRKRYVLLVPEQLPSELVNNFSRKRYLSQRISPAVFKETVSLITKHGLVLPPLKERVPAVSRDPKDDYLLVQGVINSADYLVTDDKDLLALKSVGKMGITTPAAFRKILISKNLI